MTVHLLVVVLLVSSLTFLTRAQDQTCPFSGFESHKLEVYETYGFSMINGSTPGLFLNQSKYGVEGGQVVLVNDTFYLFMKFEQKK